MLENSLLRWWLHNSLTLIIAFYWLKNVRRKSIFSGIVAWCFRGYLQELSLDLYLLPIPFSLEYILHPQHSLLLLHSFECFQVFLHFLQFCVQVFASEYLVFEEGPANLAYFVEAFNVSLRDLIMHTRR